MFLLWLVLCWIGLVLWGGGWFIVIWSCWDCWYWVWLIDGWCFWVVWCRLICWLMKLVLCCWLYIEWLLCCLYRLNCCGGMIGISNLVVVLVNENEMVFCNWCCICWFCFIFDCLYLWFFGLYVVCESGYLYKFFWWNWIFYLDCCCGNYVLELMICLLWCLVGILVFWLNFLRN